MIRDQDRVKQLQRLLGNWDPDGICANVSHIKKPKRCEYDRQGRLINLHLCGLKLAQIPSEVWQFSSLQELDLFYNQLSTLPAEIGQLSSLQELHLHENQLSTLPAEIGQLSSLQRLDLHGNPLQTPPPAIIAQGISAILAYLRKQLTIKIFYCYAHQDKGLRDQIDKHLMVLKNSGQIMTWHDRDILPGTEWKKEIDVHLTTADIILLLVSADFLNSQYCNGLEMTTALELHESGKACVIPVLLRDVYWKDAPFAKLEMLPTKAKPITEWGNKDKALRDVAEGIRKVVSSLRAQSGGLWEK